MTIREHLDRAVWFSQMGRSASATQEIQAALAILDAAERLSLYYGEPEAHTWAVVPDPEPA